MVVPNELIMSIDVGRGAECPMQALIRTDPLLQQSPTLSLTLLVAYEKLLGADSFFAPYLAVLPADYSVRPDLAVSLPPQLPP